MTIIVDHRTQLDDYLLGHNVKLVASASKHRILVSTLSLKPGETILKDTALTTSSTSPSVCHSCLRTSLKLSVCTKCKTAKYCSRTCQSHEWKKGHKVLCDILSTTKSDNADYGEVDLLIKIIIKSKTESNTIRFKSFNMLMDHLEDFDPDTLAEMNKTVDVVLNNTEMNTILSSETINPRSLALRYLGRFKSNNYVIYDDDLNVTGEGCFAIGGLFNHSCYPNVSIGFDNGKDMILRVLRDVKVGDELVVAYQDSMTSRSRRRDVLRMKYQ